MQRLVSPMVSLTMHIAPHQRIRDYYFSAPGFFAPDGSLVEAQQNVANMPKGFRFDTQIPKYLKAATKGAVDISGRTVHDGTGHAFGDKSVYGPFSQKDTIYGFWVGTGIASRVSTEGLVAFTGNEELNFLHNEGPHQAVWDPKIGLYEIVFDSTHGRHPDFKNGDLKGREDLEDRTSGKALTNTLIAEYKRLLAAPTDPLYSEAVEIKNMLKEINKTELDLEGIIPPIRPSRTSR